MTPPVAYWHVPDIDVKLAEVTTADAKVKEPSHDVGGGRMVASVIDPGGNVLGLLQTDEPRLVKRGPTRPAITPM